VEKDFREGAVSSHSPLQGLRGVFIGQIRLRQQGSNDLFFQIFALRAKIWKKSVINTAAKEPMGDRITYVF
jgi:hypothetical protein